MVNTIVVVALVLFIIFLLKKLWTSKQVKQWPKHATINKHYECIGCWEEACTFSTDTIREYFAVMSESGTEIYVVFETPELFIKGEKYIHGYREAE
ncbi:MAG: hypothetical protein NTY12_00645 [Candidatus Falkowbacteria bacterium]|nr:hypothetical protein [Candidatus Falkowbacteria bacterium]